MSDSKPFLPPSAGAQGSSLPAGAPSATPQAGALRPDVVPSTRTSASPGPASQITANPAAGPVTQGVRLRKIMLVASYDLDLALRLKSQFSAKDLRTVIVSSFNEMLRYVNDLDVSILVLDFSIESVKEGLPEVDNMHALREVRKLPKGNRLPVICAAAVESTQMVSCLIQGYSAFLKRGHLEDQMWKYIDQFLKYGKLDLNRPI